MRAINAPSDQKYLYRNTYRCTSSVSVMRAIDAPIQQSRFFYVCISLLVRPLAAPNVLPATLVDRDITLSHRRTRQLTELALMVRQPQRRQLCYTLANRQQNYCVV